MRRDEICVIILKSASQLHNRRAQHNRQSSPGLRAVQEYREERTQNMNKTAISQKYGKTYHMPPEVTYDWVRKDTIEKPPDRKSVCRERV